MNENKNGLVYRLLAIRLEYLQLKHFICLGFAGNLILWPKPISTTFVKIVKSVGNLTQNHEIGISFICDTFRWLFPGSGQGTYRNSRICGPAR